MALAPRRRLLGVPSRSIIARSTSDLLVGAHAAERGGDRLLDVGDGVEDALAAVAVLLAVAQLHRLVLARGGAAGHGRAPADAVGEDDLGLDGGVAAGIEDLARVDVGNGDHRDRKPVRRFGDGRKVIRGGT